MPYPHTRINARIELSEAGKLCASLKGQLHAARVARDRAILKGAAAGLSQRQIASEADVSVARVNQVLEREGLTATT